MESIPINPVLKYNTDQLKLVRKQYNLDKPGDISRAVDILEAWIKMQKHFMKKELPRKFLENAIIANKGSLERTKQRLDKICTFRTMLPNFFGENLIKYKFDDLNMMQSILLPKPTDEHYRVFLLKVIGSTFTAESILNLYRYVILICEYFFAYDYCAGAMIVIDYNDANILEMIKALNLTHLREIFAIVTEGYSMRLKGIHLITPSKAVDALVTIFKPLIGPKLAKRICVHKDLSTLFEYVPQDRLPKEYGGKENSIAELCDELRNELTGDDFVNYIKEMNKAKTEESCRQTDKFNENYLGMPGSFRTLTVD